MRKTIYFICGILLITLFTRIDCYANFGAVDSSALVEGKNILFKQEKDINIIVETLHIDLDCEYVDVNVEYTLLNKGDEKDVDFAFPIFTWIEEHGLNKTYIDNINIKENGTRLNYDTVRTEDYEGNFNDKYINREQGYSGRIIRENLISSIHFHKDEIKKINISYRTKGMYLDGGYDSIPDFSESYFAYELAPAAYWGDGKATYFSLSVDYNDLLKNNGKILKINMPNFNLNNQSGIYRYTKESFNYKDNPLIEIDYKNNSARKKDYLDKVRLPQSVLSNFEVSSTLKNEGSINYNKYNLFDNNLETCWCEGIEGYGVGESVHLKIKDDVSLSVVAMINGYVRDKNTYYDNSRIKKIKVEYLKNDKVEYENVIELKDIKYEGLSKKYEYDSMNVIADNRSFGHPITNDLKITILEVYPGKLYKDTCISELFLFTDIDS